MTERPGPAEAALAIDEAPLLDLALARQQLLAYARDLRGALADSRRVAGELAATHVETVAALAAAVDTRDSVTGGHVQRVARYGVIVAEEVAPELCDDPQLVYGFLLHDIGKIAIPDRILKKPSPLDAEERRIMRQHVAHGVRFVRGVSFLRPALDLIATHHERIDGRGYPQGLRGDEIPLGTRIFSVCDAYDAMTHDRPYRRAVPTARALEQLRLCAGSQFDPDVVDAFEGCFDRIAEVGDRPPLPPARAPKQRRPGTVDDVLGEGAVIDSLEHAVALLARDGAIVHANEAFRRALGLTEVPIGMTLAELVRREGSRFHEAGTGAARLRILEHDLLEGSRTGTLRVRGGATLRWTSSVLRSRGGEALGRVIEFETAATAGARAAADELIEVLSRRPATPDDDWYERLHRARDTVSRVSGLIDRMIEDAPAEVCDG